MTRPGLSQKVGEAAINPVPKAMILKAVEDAADRYHYEGGLKVTISVPEGEQIAKRLLIPVWESRVASLFLERPVS